MKPFFFVIMLGLLAVPTAPAATITDDFSSGRDDWFASQGDWQVRDQDTQPRRDVYEDLAQHGVTHGGYIQRRRAS